MPATYSGKEKMKITERLVHFTYSLENDFVPVHINLKKRL